jgi:hypothetical protein
MPSSSNDLDVPGKPKRTKSLIHRFKKSRPSDDMGSPLPLSPNLGENDSETGEELQVVDRRPGAWAKRKQSSGNGVRPIISAPISPPLDPSAFLYGTDDNATPPQPPPRNNRAVARANEGVGNNRRRDELQRKPLPSLAPKFDEKRPNGEGQQANLSTLGRKTSMLQRMKGNFIRKSLSK